MLDLPRQMYRGTLTASSATLATIPSGVVWVVRNLIVSNITASAATVTVNFAGTALLSAVSVPGNGVVTFDLAQVLVAGNTITGLASAATTLNLAVAGIEVVI